MSASAATASSTLSALVQDFFVRHLVVERNVSRNTVLSYRDGLKLFLRYLCRNGDRSPETLVCEVALDPERVRGFLRWLAKERGNAASTRNLRLAAIKAFARYVAWRAPEHLDRCRLIRELPRARTEKPEVEYLEGSELRRLVDAIEPSHASGLRDRALLLLLYNAGARVQEVCDLDVRDARLDTAPSVHVVGKGRKARVCPLWPRTVSALQAWLRCRGQPEQDSPLFLNARGRRLSRSGVAYVLARAAQAASLERPKRARHITPHVIRHTTAMHMLQGGVDLTVIASWLGHSKLSTTHGYVTIDLRMKQEALAVANVLPELRDGAYPSTDVIAWLEALARPVRYVECYPSNVPTDRQPEPCTT